jgi:predicted enzyme related to lactoylglutathione lyase
MALIRHFAMCVGDLDKAAQFYSDAFGMKRHGREDLSIGSAVYMGDGTINLALLNFTGAKGHDFGDDAKGQTGPNHFGFQVESIKDTQALIEQHGGTFFFDLGDERKGNFERKFKDPEGIIFDVSENGWVGTATRKIKSDPDHAFLDEVLVKPEALGGRIKHFTVTVRDLEKASAFYRTVFGLQFVNDTETPGYKAINLTDGITNLMLMRPNKPDEAIKPGPHHFGVQVLDQGRSDGAIAGAGGKAVADYGTERVFKDRDGIAFATSAQGWIGSDSAR